MARINRHHTPSNGAPGIIVRRRKRDRERLRQRWEKQKSEETRKSTLKNQQSQEEGQADVNTVTPDESVAKGENETEEATSIGSEGERGEVLTDAVPDATVNIEMGEVKTPTPEPSEPKVLGTEVQSLIVQASNENASTLEEEKEESDEAGSIRNNTPTTGAEPYDDMPPTAEATEETEHGHIPVSDAKSSDPATTVEEESHDTHHATPEATDELDHANGDADSNPKDTEVTKHRIKVQAPRPEDESLKPLTNILDEKRKPSLTPLRPLKPSDDDDTLPTPPLSAHEPERRSCRIQVVVATPQRTRTPRKAQVSTPASNVEIEPRYSLRNSARKATVSLEETEQAPATPTAKKRKRRASLATSPDSWMQSEDITGDIRPDEAATEDIVLSSAYPETPGSTTPPPKRRKSARKSIVASPYFTAPSTPATAVKVKGSGRTSKGISVIPWPPYTSEKFGLVQEDLHDNPFHLLISTTFLNRTKGSVARPLLDKFLSLYPTPEILSAAPQADLETFLQPLGLHRIRAERFIKMATEWLVNPPGTVEKMLYNYPPRDTPSFPIPGREPRRVETKQKWEIAHLPGVGAYALDSWRIFCRDTFLGGVKQGEEEWRKVVPKDKELRAYCRWRWAKEGVVWEEEGDAFVKIGAGHEEEGNAIVKTGAGQEEDEEE